MHNTYMWILLHTYNTVSITIIIMLTTGIATVQHERIHIQDPSFLHATAVLLCAYSHFSRTTTVRHIDIAIHFMFYYEMGEWKKTECHIGMSQFTGRTLDALAAWIHGAVTLWGRIICWLLLHHSHCLQCLCANASLLTYRSSLEHITDVLSLVFRQFSLPLLRPPSPSYLLPIIIITFCFKTCKYFFVVFFAPHC